MATTLQSQFYKFHETIKLIDSEDNSPVRDKRDMLIKEIEAYLKKKSEDEGTPSITFYSRNQGSYAMSTGVKPMREEEDYDIDVALFFNVSTNDYTPIEVKDWVYQAFKKGAREVSYKRPCIRVQYKEDGVPKFHIDFAVYSSADKNEDNKNYFGRGKRNTNTWTIVNNPNPEWEFADPVEFIKLFNAKYEDTDSKAQMKRVIRYLKRWKDNKFADTVGGTPTGIALTGIALTALAYHGFVPYVINKRTKESEISDITATKEFVIYVLSQFYAEGTISVQLPTAQTNDPSTCKC